MAATDAAEHDVEAGAALARRRFCLCNVAPDAVGRKGAVGVGTVWRLWRVLAWEQVCLAGCWVTGASGMSRLPPDDRESKADVRHNFCWPSGGFA
jgi:hypothetical protein